MEIIYSKTFKKSVCGIGDWQAKICRMVCLCKFFILIPYIYSFRGTWRLPRLNTPRGKQIIGTLAQIFQKFKTAKQLNNDPIEIIIIFSQVSISYTDQPMQRQMGWNTETEKYGVLYWSRWFANVKANRVALVMTPFVSHYKVHWAEF